MSLADYEEHLKKTESKKNKDERIWTTSPDASGNATAVIRFLPPPKGEPRGAAWVKLLTHFFKGKTGRYYSENCLRTLDQDCPVCILNRELWATGDEGEAIVRGSKDNPGRKAKTNYYSNIFVVEDSANPENEGKVFLFRYGVKIFEKVHDMLHEEKIDIFDMKKGRDFKIKQVKVSGFPNYDKSSFASKESPIAKSDKAIKEIHDSCYSLQEIVSSDKFLSYDEAEKKMNSVIHGKSSKVMEKNNDVVEEKQEKEPVSKREVEEETKKVLEEDVHPVDDDVDDVVAEFESLFDD